MCLQYIKVRADVVIEMECIKKKVSVCVFCVWRRTLLGQESKCHFSCCVIPVLGMYYGGHS